MLTEICAYLKNWFDMKSDHTYLAEYKGAFTITDGVITDAAGNAVTFLDGQYFRIIDSVLNDGVWKYGAQSGLRNETFEGTIRGMAVPSDLVDIADDIEAWQQKYGSSESDAMSPFASESFGGYSYSKPAGVTGGTEGGSGASWQSAFGTRLARYRKI